MYKQAEQVGQVFKEHSKNVFFSPFATLPSLKFILQYGPIHQEKVALHY